MKKFLSTNTWIWSAILYPLSWVYYSGPNLAFLAWVSFVPLFMYLKDNHKSFKKFVGSSLIVTSCWTFTTAAWLFNFPNPSWQIFITVFLETLHIAFPFLILYMIQRKTNFELALALFPFQWTAWEWLFLTMQHTMGTHLLPYSQGNMNWLIQMADIGGMWLISFWVMLFNVVVFFTYKKSQSKLLSRRFFSALIKVAGVMIAPVLIYGMYCQHNYANDTTRHIKVSIVPTQIDPEYMTGDMYQKSNIESTLHLTDSLAFHQLKQENPSDLYVWPETGTANWMDFPNINNVLQQATTDWTGALITGCKGVRKDSEEFNAYVSAILISPKDRIQDSVFQYHDKTVLTPGGEMIPYRKAFSSLFKEEIKPGDKMPYSRGKSFSPLKLVTKSGEQFASGVSLCYEQWFPHVWTKQVEQGAEYFIHMASEGWYGNHGFQQFMLNVNRFRAIENRRSVARSSNKGISTFIDQLGNTYGELSLGSLNTTTADVQTNRNVTFFSRYPNLFPMLFLLVSLMGLGLKFYGRTFSQIL